MHPPPHIDIPAAEQVSLNHLTVPELSPSDPISNASSPSSSEPVTPVDVPPFSSPPPDPLVDGKHQPDPRPYKPAPVARSASRLGGTVSRARQVLSNLGKRKRQPSADAGISTGVQILPDNVQETSERPAETELPPSQILFSLPNDPIDSTPRIQATGPQVIRSLTRRSTHDTLLSAPASPTTPTFSGLPFSRTPVPPGSPWTPPSLASRIVFFVPWCIAVGAAIALYPRGLASLVRIYKEPPLTPLQRLAHHAHTAPSHIGIFAGVLCLTAAMLPGWLLRVTLVGAVAIRAVMVWRGFEAQVEKSEEGPDEEWREDARCVWRVLRGEEEMEILRACAGEGTFIVKEE